MLESLVYSKFQYNPTISSNLRGQNEDLAEMWHTDPDTRMALKESYNNREKAIMDEFSRMNNSTQEEMAKNNMFVCQQFSQLTTYYIHKTMPYVQVYDLVDYELLHEFVGVNSGGELKIADPTNFESFRTLQDWKEYSNNWQGFGIYSSGQSLTIHNDFTPEGSSKTFFEYQKERILDPGMYNYPR